MLEEMFYNPADDDHHTHDDALAQANQAEAQYAKVVEELGGRKAIEAFAEKSS